MSGPVGSIPSFTRSGLPDASLRSSSPAGSTSTAFRVSSATSSATAMRPILRAVSLVLVFVVLAGLVDVVMRVVAGFVHVVVALLRRGGAGGPPAEELLDRVEDSGHGDLQCRAADVRSLNLFRSPRAALRTDTAPAPTPRCRTRPRRRDSSGRGPVRSRRR